MYEYGIDYIDKSIVSHPVALKESKPKEIIQSEQTLVEEKPEVKKDEK